MKRLAWSALAATVVALAACDGSTPTTAIPAATHAVGIVPADPLEPWVEPTDSSTYPPADGGTAPAATQAVGIVPADPLEPWVEPTDSTTYPPADTATAP